MFGGFFNWVRRRTAESVILGLQDGIAAVSPDDDPDPAEHVRALREQLAASLVPVKALAAGEDDGEGRKARGRK